MAEARLEHITHGLAPVTDGWFVVNAADAQWIHHPDFGWSCPFEASGSVLRGRDDLEPVKFPQLGLNIFVLTRGSAGLYHREDQQEDFLVLEGECLLLVEGEERPLRQWDFVHSPPGTAHVLVGTSDDPCIVLRIGVRLGGSLGLFYPRDEVAVRHGAAADHETSSAIEAYAPHGHWQPSEKPPGLR